MAVGSLWSVVDEIVKSEGLELFDLEIPSGPSGVLKVFISNPRAKDGAGSTGVQLQQCALVSKRILNLENIEELLPGQQLIEVSSPGINRKLSRPEHFEGAIGERIKLKLNQEVANSKVLIGKLLDFNSGTLSVVDEASQKRHEIPLSQISKARVDFLFD